MGTCPSHQPWLCSTLHRCSKQLRRRGWLACFLSPGVQEGPGAGSGVPLQKAALSAVLSPALQSQMAKHCRLPWFPKPVQAPRAFFCGSEAAVRAPTHQASVQLLGQTWCFSGCVYPENSHLNVKMPLRGPLPCESSPDHHSLCGPFLPLAVPCMVQLVVKCSYTLSLP